MERAQLFYLLLLPEGDDPSLPEGSAFTAVPAGGRTHWELVLDEGGPQTFARDIERERFIERLVATCPRRWLLYATGPIEKVFGDAPKALATFLEPATGGWVNDLVAARLLSRTRALELAPEPRAAQQLHIATYEPGPGVVTRGMLKLGHPELAIRYDRGPLRDHAKSALLEIAEDVMRTGKPLGSGGDRSIGGHPIEVSVPPGVYTAKIASAPSGAHDHHQHWVQRALEDQPFAPGGVLVIDWKADDGEVATVERLKERDPADLPVDFQERGVAGYESAAQALAAILGNPDRALRIASEEAPDDFLHALHYEEKVAQGGGEHVRDLYVSAGFSERPQIGPLVDHRVELGFITPTGGAEWVPHILLNLRAPAGETTPAAVQFTAGVTIEVDLELPELSGFGGLLFIPPVFLPAEDATLAVAPPGEEAHEVLVLLVVPLTKAELEFKTTHGFEALVERLQDKFPGGRWLVAQERESAA